ncbi:hypothetical protein ACFFIA_31285 [Phytohabitans kaempferiae]|uniref:Uncharacterized protein n=1 Tax=Phytohabitans kaempferiae TaxID=1620943 RepID=A0ABV6MCI0_9ACTN
MLNANLQSVGSYICGGTGNCSGTYWAGGLFTLTLPTGWIWTGEPEHCILLSPESLTCSAVSDPPLYVPPTHS